jgi:hypothetical protein
MWNRYWPFLLPAVACVLLILGFRYTLSPNASYAPVTITPEAYDQIEVGMRREQVEAVIGSRPGDFRRHSRGEKAATAVARKTPSDMRKAPGPGRTEWWGDEYVIVIWEDAQGRVAGTALNKQVPGKPDHPWDKVRTALGW